MVQYTSNGVLFDLPTEYYTDFQPSGKGAFGCVVKAKYNHKQIAIKKIINCLCDIQSIKRLIRESILLRSLRHSNIIRCVDIVYPRLTYSTPGIADTTSTATTTTTNDTVQPNTLSHTALNINLADDIQADMVDTGAHMTVHSYIDNSKQPTLQRQPTTDNNTNSVYLVTPAVDTDLYKIIRSSQTLTTAHIQWIMYQLLSAVEYLHSLNILHRDIKPSNVLIDASCHIYLCDFGLGRIVDDINTTKSTAVTDTKAVSGLQVRITTDSNSNNDDLINDILNGDDEDETKESEPTLTRQIGSRWYRAPEIYLAPGEYGAPSDIWSVGTVLAELLGRQPCFMGRDNKHQLELICQLLGKPSMYELQCYDDFNDYKQYISTLTIKRKQLLSSDIDELKIKFPFADNTVLDLLSKLLVFDPSKRLTASQALQHPYFNTIQTVQPSKHKLQATKQLKHDLAQFAQFESETHTLDSIRELFERILTLRNGVTDLYKPLQTSNSGTNSYNNSRRGSQNSKHDAGMTSARVLVNSNKATPTTNHRTLNKENKSSNTLGVQSTYNTKSKRYTGEKLGVDFSKLNIKKQPAVASARVATTKSKGSNMFESFRK